MCNHGDTDMAHDDSLPEVNPFMAPNPWGGEERQGPPRGAPHDVPPHAVADLRQLPRAASRRKRRHATATSSRLAGRDMFAVHTPGHTLDHLCMHDPEGGFVFTGDHLLPHITPYISGLAGGSNPLLDYFASLERTAELADVEAGAARARRRHRRRQRRCQEIIEHHHERFERLRKGSAELGKAATCASCRSSCSVPRSSAPMADGEAYAHLEWLRQAGRADIPP